MNNFSYDQPMILDGLSGAGNPSKPKSKLERAFTKIRKVLTPKAKWQLDDCEFDSRTARRAAEVTLEAEGRQGKSIKRKLLEGCDPFSRLKVRVCLQGAGVSESVSVQKLNIVSLPCSADAAARTRWTPVAIPPSWLRKTSTRQYRH